jgi:FkbM family methyltransferase
MAESAGDEFISIKDLNIGNVEIKIAGRVSDNYFKNAENQVHDNIFLACAAGHTLAGPGVVVDVGANIGVTTSLLAKIRNKDDIYAIEPSPNTFIDLTRTIALNGLGNVKASNIGLGAKPGRLILKEDPSNSSAANFLDDASPDEGDPRSVIVQTLDDFCSAHDIRPHFLKIDVEGFELNVLRGGFQIIKECSPILFIELNTFTMLAYGRVNPLDVIDFLANNFSQILWLDGNNIECMSDQSSITNFLGAHYSRHSGIDDLLCVPRGASINMDALKSDIKRLRHQAPSANAHLGAVLDSTTWKIAKNIQRLAKPLKGIQRLAGPFKGRSDRPT